MTDAYSEKLKNMKEDIIKNFDELSSTDLMQLSGIAKEIVEKRDQKCKEDGLYGDVCDDVDCKANQKNKFFRISYEKDLFGLWRRIYIFNKCINGKLIARWVYK